MTFGLSDDIHSKDRYSAVQVITAVLYCFSTARRRASNRRNGCTLCVNDTGDKWQHSVPRAV